jgi:hypothetical protein
MQGFLVGGNPELQDITYEMFPCDWTVLIMHVIMLFDLLPFLQARTKAINKLGFRTETMGSIKIRLNIMHQSGYVTFGYLDGQRIYPFSLRKRTTGATSSRSPT